MFATVEQQCTEYGISCKLSLILFPMQSTKISMISHQFSHKISLNRTLFSWQSWFSVTKSCLPYLTWSLLSNISWILYTSLTILSSCSLLIRSLQTSPTSSTTTLIRIKIWIWYSSSPTISTFKLSYASMKSVVLF